MAQNSQITVSNPNEPQPLTQYPGQVNHFSRAAPEKIPYAIERFKKETLRVYGVLERQFSGYFQEASRRKGRTGEEMLALLERRLDNAVHRMGFAASRAEARQLVRHGHVKVNGRRVTIPSYMVRKGDVVSLGDKAKAMIVIRHNIDVLDRQVPAWLESGEGGSQVTVRDTPLREHIDVPVREQLIVELYSK